MENEKLKLQRGRFNCPHCNTKNTTYTLKAKIDDSVRRVTKTGSIEGEDFLHVLVKCNDIECGRITYFQILQGSLTSENGYQNIDDLVYFQYPSRYYELPSYIPQKIANYYREAIQAYDFGLLNSASIMCRKTIYEICDKNKANGRDYKEKIKDLGLDKRITDPLLNIKSIGDDTVHATGWDVETVFKSIEALGIIIDMIYTQEERIKAYSKHFSRKKQEEKNNS